MSKPALLPKLRFPEFRDAGEWSSTVLGELSEVVRGGSPRPIDGFLTTAVDGLNWLKIGDVDKEAKYVTQTAEKVRPEALSKTRVVNPGDLILSNSMSFGRPYILQIKTCIHDGWIAVTHIADKVTRDYLYYLISEPNSQRYFLNNAAGSGVQNLNADIIKALAVCHPSSPEQQKIADCLSSLDELIAAQARKVEALKTHKKGLMQQLFPREGETQPRLRFPEFRDAGEWWSGPISQFAEINPRREVRPDEIEVSFVPMNAVSENGFLAIRQTRNYGSVKKGFTAFRDCDVIVAKITPCFENGKAALVRGLENGVGFGSTEFHVVRANKFCLPEFLFAQLYSDQFRSLGKSSMTGSGGHQRVPTSFVEEYVICVPGLPEQHRITDCVSSLDTLITAATQELETLKTHKKGLMQQLFPSAEEVAA